MKRLFVCIDLPESIASALAKMDPEIRGVRWLRAEQLHLTLNFLGEVAREAEEKLRAQLAAIRVHKFFLPLGGLGTFPPRGHSKIIWIGVGRGHPHLFQLHKRVAEAALAAGLEPDLRSWHPHLTLARCHDSLGQTALEKFLKQNAGLEVGLLQVTNFLLCSSQLTPAGSIYTRELAVTLE